MVHSAQIARKRRRRRRKEEKHDEYFRSRERPNQEKDSEGKEGEGEATETDQIPALVGRSGLGRSQKRRRERRILNRPPRLLVPTHHRRAPRLASDSGSERPSGNCVCGELKRWMHPYRNPSPLPLPSLSLPLSCAELRLKQRDVEARFGESGALEPEL